MEWVKVKTQKEFDAAVAAARVTATKFVSVHIHADTVEASGGVRIVVPRPATLRAWLDFHDISPSRGTVALFKAVRADWKSSRGHVYEPGTVPLPPPDWDGGKAECGGGLHFACSPIAALAFDDRATKFVACPIKLKDIAFHKNAQFPTKVKARAICAPVWECDINGDPVKK